MLWVQATGSIERTQIWATRQHVQTFPPWLVPCSSRLEVPSPRSQIHQGSLLNDFQSSKLSKSVMILQASLDSRLSTPRLPRASSPRLTSSMTSHLYRCPFSLLLVRAQYTARVMVALIYYAQEAGRQRHSTWASSS